MSGFVETPRPPWVAPTPWTFVTLTIRTDDGIEGIGYAAFQAVALTAALKETVDGLDERGCERCRQRDGLEGRGSC